MRLTYAVHILAGTLSLLFGYIAMFSVKGASLHRKAGMFFVYSMIPMALFGTLMSVWQGVAPAINVPAGALTTYLVITSLATVRPSIAGLPWLNTVALLVALSVASFSLMFGFQAIANGGTREGMPAFPFFMFGVVALLGSLGDIRVLRSGALRGPSRLARHLWRMCFALFIAALSFFIGQADVFPKAIRIRPMLALPVLLVLVTMFYWLWRVRFKRSLRGIVGVRAVEAV